MWVITTRGFFSAVQHRKHPDRVLVRARCEEDIRELEKITGVEPFPLDFSDYEWRMELPKTEWVKALDALGTDIDYDNFKNTVSKRQGADRSGVYHRVWGNLLDIERPDRYKYGASWPDLDGDGHISAGSTGIACSDCGEGLMSHEKQCPFCHGAPKAVAKDKPKPKAKPKKGKAKSKAAKGKSKGKRTRKVPHGQKIGQATGGKRGSRR
jgi:hypothetical protein